MNTFLLLLPCEIMKTQWRFPLSLLFSSRVVPVLILELFSNYNYQGVSFNLLHLFPIPWWHYSTLSKLWSQIKNKWQIKRFFPLEHSFRRVIQKMNYSLNKKSSLNCNLDNKSHCNLSIWWIFYQIFLSI